MTTNKVFPGEVMKMSNILSHLTNVWVKTRTFFNVITGSICINSSISHNCGGILDSQSQNMTVHQGL